MKRNAYVSAVVTDDDSREHIMVTVELASERLSFYTARENVFLDSQPAPGRLGGSRISWGWVKARRTSQRDGIVRVKFEGSDGKGNPLSQTYAFPEHETRERIVLDRKTVVPPIRWAFDRSSE